VQHEGELPCDPRTVLLGRFNMVWKEDVVFTEGGGGGGEEGKSVPRLHNAEGPG